MPPWYLPMHVNTLRSKQNGQHFPDDIFKCIFLNENVWILIKISFNFVPKGPINNIPALVQVMAWCRPGAKPLSKPLMVRLSKHIYVTQPRWVIVFHDEKFHQTPQFWELMETATIILCFSKLTHWGQVTHICVSKLSILGSDNGLSPDRRQAIIWTNAGILLIWPLGTNFSEILIAINTFSFMKMHLKMSLENGGHLSRPQCVN